MISKTHIFLVVAALCLCFASFVHGGEKKPPGSTLASRVEGLLDAMKETHYQAKTEIDEENGSLRCDCSGLLCFVLRHEFPEAYLSLRGSEASWRTRPYSVTFCETFISAGDQGVGEGGWRRIRKMMDVCPGDVLAWRKDSIERGVSTGHTCMIAGLPEMEKDAQFIGLDKAAAIVLAEESKLQWRIVREDGTIEPVSMKLRNNRVNFVVAKGRVIRARRG